MINNECHYLWSLIVWPVQGLGSERECIKHRHMRVTYVKSFISKTEGNKPLCRYKLRRLIIKWVLTIQCQAQCTILTINSSRSARPGELRGI